MATWCHCQVDIAKSFVHEGLRSGSAVLDPELQLKYFSKIEIHIIWCLKKTQAISTDPPNLRKMRLGVNKFSININGIPHPKQFKAMFLAGHTFSLAVGRKLDFRCHLLPGFILGPSWLWAWDLGYKSFSKRLPAVTICMQETSGGFKRDIGKYRNVHTTENLHK